MKSQNLYFGIIALAVLVISGCSSTPEMASKWRQLEIIVDGLDNEWQQDMIYLEKEKIAVAFKNDADNLYLSVKTIDRETQMKIVRGGMTIWFDSTGGEKKVLGIHFPIGSEGVGEVPTHTRGSREEINESNDYRALEDRFAKMLLNMEIIGPGPVDKKQIPVSTSYKSYGIKIGMRDTMGTLFYELVIPLKVHLQIPLAIGSDTGKTIGIGIFTENMRRSMTARSPDEGSPNGGYGKPGMGGGGGGGRRGFGGSGQSQESNSPIEYHAKVKISSSP